LGGFITSLLAYFPSAIQPIEAELLLREQGVAAIAVDVALRVQTDSEAATRYLTLAYDASSGTAERPSPFARRLRSTRIILIRC
jgi:hypothetical protein